MKYDDYLKMIAARWMQMGFTKPFSEAIVKAAWERYKSVPECLEDCIDELKKFD